MSHTIKFSVHRNPMKDADGKDTFQVRHETNYTAMKADFMEHIKQHHSMRPEVMDMALAVLEDEIRSSCSTISACTSRAWAPSSCASD